MGKLSIWNLPHQTKKYQTACENLKWKLIMWEGFLRVNHWNKDINLTCKEYCIERSEFDKKKEMLSQEISDYLETKFKRVFIETLKSLTYTQVLRIQVNRGWYCHGGTKHSSWSEILDESFEKINEYIDEVEEEKADEVAEYNHNL